MDVGFAIICSLARHRRPQIQFLFIGSRVCSALLSDPPRSDALRFTNPFSSGWVGDFHPQAIETCSAHKSRARDIVPLWTNHDSSASHYRPGLALEASAPAVAAEAFIGGFSAACTGPFEPLALHSNCPHRYFQPLAQAYFRACRECPCFPSGKPAHSRAPGPCARRRS